MQTYSEVLDAATGKLGETECETPKLDARLLLQFACGIEHAGLISQLGELLSKERADEYTNLIEQRIAGRSVHRIIGYREFFGHNFKLSAETLEPRPDTECLVERVLADDHGPNPRFVDIGTGSGAIAISLLKALREAKCIASDISAGALETAKSNAAALEVADRIEFVQGNYCDDLVGPFDFLVSNPPYIVSGEIQKLRNEVREFDPALALDGGTDGLDAYRDILKSAPEIVKPGGKLYLEIGYDQNDDLRALSMDYGLEYVETIRDLAGLNRVVVLINQ